MCSILAERQAVPGNMPLAKEGSAWSDCASGWEADPKIRARFKKGLPWVQWPICGRDEVANDHNPSTKALELNSGALVVMLKCFGTEFIDIDRLQRQASHVLKFMGCTLPFLKQSLSIVLRFPFYGPINIPAQVCA